MAKSRTSFSKPAVSSFDPFFHLVPGGDFNACIGKQGSEENYLDGYMDAAQELASAVIDKRLFGKRDTLAMPILYNARHALELTLKFAIEQLRKLERPIAWVRRNHDIEAQWGALHDSTVGDETVREIVKQLEPYVASLASIDDDGQELRYATNRDGDRSMDALSLVDLELVKVSLDELAKLLSKLKYRVEDLGEEKASGTWTTECSRSDLMEIAKILPPRDKWNSAEFTDAKRVAMERFNLGSRRFSDAVKKIESSRLGRSIIGWETPLTHLTDEHVLLAVELWREQNPPAEREADEEIVIYSVKRLREQILERRQVAGGRNEMLERLLSELAPDEIADLEAIFYLGRQGWMPEFYDETLERTKREHAVARNLKMKLNHIMVKLNFANEVQKGLKSLGKLGLADKVEALLSDAKSAHV